MNRKRATLIISGLVLSAALLAYGYFLVKKPRLSHLRHEAMAAYENREYEQAERLLLQYVKKDPNAETGFVALANIYHEFGNVEMEAQMWQTASSLNPQDPEYRANMLNSMVKAANYALLHGILGRKAQTDNKFTDQELYLFVISSYRSGYPKDGDDACKKYVALDPEAFHKNDLGRLAEFLSAYETLSDSSRDIFLRNAMKSEDPAIRFEAVYSTIRRMEQLKDDGNFENDEEMEMLLKQAVDANYYAGTALLADFYFSKYRFDEAIEVLEPYLKTIDDSNLFLLYAESCAFTGRKDKLEALEKKLRQKTGYLPLLADYCDILVAYLENDERRLAVAVRKSGKHIQSPLSRFIRLRVAVENDSFNEILSVVQEVFSFPPFHDLHDRALFVCLDYLTKKMRKPDAQNDFSQAAELTRILSACLKGNRFLTDIILLDQYRSGVAKEDDLTAALKRFPDDILLQRITAEYLLFNEKAERALPIIEQMLNDGKTEDLQAERGIRILFMLALDQAGRHDEAAAVFRELAEKFETDQELLEQYFQFCVNNKRSSDLVAAADRLDSSKDNAIKPFGKFFRAAALLLTDDMSKKNEALDLLVSTPADNPDFTFYAANRLYQYGRLDEAEAKYKAILTTYRTPSLPYVNLSNLYRDKGEDRKAGEAAKKAFELDRESMLPAFVYATRLFEAEQYGEAVDVLKFPRHRVNYREDIVDLWCECMRHVVEKSFAERKFLQAEEQCKHILIIRPDNEFGKENLEKVRAILFPKKDGASGEKPVPAA